MNKQSSKTYYIILYTLLALGLIIVFTPFLYMVTVSLSSNAYVMPYPPKIIPEEFVWENFSKVWEDNSFYIYFINSILVASLTTVGGLFITALCAYGFSKFEFIGKEILFKLFLFSMMVPGILNIIPQYTIVRSFGLIDTYIGLIMIYIGTGIAGNTFFLRSFFESIPVELEESVIIDGGNRWTVFKNIIMPLSAPCIGTFSIFAFTNAWDEFFTALTILKTPAKRTLPIAIKLFEGQHVSNFSLIFAASLITILPIIIVFVVFQKHLIKGGITEGAVKG